MIWFVLVLGLVFRATNLGLLPPFVDETGVLVATRDYNIHPVMERLFGGKYFGYLPQRLAVELANDPIWAGRALSAFAGFLATVLAADTVRRIGGMRSALICAVLLALNPQLVFHDRLALPESIAVCFAAAACWFLSLGRQRMQPGMFWLAGATAACAVATKVYVLPILLVLPALALGSAGASIRNVLPELLRVAGGFIAAGTLIFLTALDPSWTQNFSLHDALIMPRMIVANQAAVVSPFGARLVNGLGLLNAYQPIVIWVLIALLFFRLSGFRRDALGCLAVAAFGFVLYALVFRSFVATRYFNIIWLPLSLGAALAAGGEDQSDAAPNPVMPWVRRAQLVLLLLAAIQCGRRDSLLLFRPESFPLPHSDRYQYLTGWPSGSGLASIVGYLRNRALESAKPLLVVTLQGFRHGNTTLPLMMSDEPRVRFISAWEGNDYVSSHLPAWLSGNVVLVLVEPMGTPVDFKRTEAAGFSAAQVFATVGNENVPLYKIYQFERKPAGPAIHAP